MSHHHKHHSWLHRATHSLAHQVSRAEHFTRREVKKETRLTARYTARAYPYIAGGITAVASYAFTPVAGAVIGTALTEGGYYVGSTAARSHHKHGQDARAAGRRERLRTGEASLIGLGVGSAAGLAASAFAAPAASSSSVSIAGSGADVISDVAVPAGATNGILGTGLTTAEAGALLSGGSALVSHFLTPANPASYPPDYASDLGAMMGGQGGGDQPGNPGEGLPSGGFDVGSPDGQRNVLLVVGAVLFAWFLAKA